MAEVSGTLAFISAHPKAERVRAFVNASYNSLEPGIITVTFPADYRQMKMITLNIRGTPPATLPTFVDGEKAVLQHVRSGTIHGGVHSLPTTFYTTGGTALDNISWDWDPLILTYLPVIFPNDTLVVHFPAIDTNVSPTADVVLSTDLLVIKR